LAYIQNSLLQVEHCSSPQPILLKKDHTSDVVHEGHGK